MIESAGCYTLSGNIRYNGGMARICVASHHGSLGELRSDPEFIEIARRNDTLIELRLDQYSDLSAANLEATLCAFDPSRVLVTYRSPDEGGRNPSADDRQRFDYLTQATSLGAAFVDVELATLRRCPNAWCALRTARFHKVQFVVSFHDFKGSPTAGALRGLRREAEDAGADVVKFAVSAATLFDSVPLLDLLLEPGWTKPFLGLAMGEAGRWSRVLGPRFPTPAPFTFARCCHSPGTAPGQPTWKELADHYRFPQIQPDGPVYAVMGDARAPSLVPRLINSALIETHRPGLCLPIHVSGDPCAFVREMAVKLGIKGLAVEAPHQSSIQAACTGASDLVRRTGAADTLVCREGTGWDADHTAAWAVADLLAEALGGALHGRRILVLGTDPMVRASAFALTTRGVELIIGESVVERARELSAAVGGTCVLWKDIHSSLEAIAVVSATSKSHATSLEAARLPAGCLVFETGYGPEESPLLREAREAGHRTIDGLDLLVRRTAVQFALFTGAHAPFERMRRIAQIERIRGMEHSTER